jgi:eukaryotic-like serine/threonine-protein kinase
MKDRRRTERSSVAVPMRVRIPSLETAFQGETLNISQGGVFLAVDPPPEIGSLVELDIAVGVGACVFRGEGVVVRHQLPFETTGIGIQFKKVEYQSPELLKRIQKDEHLFGNYLLEAMIGFGGMARVYRSSCLFGPLAGQRLAIKRMLEQFESEPLMVSLFEQEAKVLKQLDHPHIVKSHTAGKVGSAHFIALEYIGGCNAALLCERLGSNSEVFPIDYAVEIVRSIASALAYMHNVEPAQAHGPGILHCDVAPSNILLGRDGSIKLTDFGVIRTQDSDKAFRVEAGKSAYLSPERINQEPPNPSSDVFALGAVLYELLTGVQAFQGHKSGDVFRNIKRGKFVSPQTRRPDIPDDLAQFVEQSISPHVAGRSYGPIKRLSRRFSNRPLLRFATAQDFLNALDNILVPLKGTSERLGKLVGRLFPNPIHHDL